MYPKAGGAFRVILRGVAAGILCGALAGCLAAGRGAPSRAQPGNSDLRSINLALTDAQSGYYYSIDEPSRKAYRSELVAARMYAIDLQYTEFEEALLRERQGVGFLSTTASLGLTGAVPLVDSTRVKDILGAAGAFVTGTRAAYSDEVLLKTTIQLIINQMRASRDKVKTKIILKRDQSTIQYPLADALSDVEAYYRAGTLVSGIVEATETVGEKAAILERSKDFAEIKGIAQDDTYYSLESYLYEGGRLNNDRLQQLRGILKETHPGLRLSDVLQDPDSASIRTELLKAINK